MRQRARVYVALTAGALLAVLTVQAQLALLGGGYLALPGGGLLDWGSFVPAPVVWALERRPAPIPCQEPSGFNRCAP